MKRRPLEDEEAAAESLRRPGPDHLRSVLRRAAGKGPSRHKAVHEPQTSIAKVERDRSRKNSRVKGSRAELDVARVFSEWCGEEVRRTPLSGGWSTSRFGVTGDLVCANRVFPFHVEIKHREGWCIDDLITGVRADHDKSIVQWWRQCVESCPKKRGKNGLVMYRKEPLLVFRRNRQPWLVMWPVRSDTRVPAASLTVTLPLDSCPLCRVFVSSLDQFIATQTVPYGMRNHERNK